jgi:hypothetical protein
MRASVCLSCVSFFFFFFFVLPVIASQETQYAHPAIERELREKRKDLKEKRVEVDLLNKELSELRRERDAYLRLAWFACLSTTGALCGAWVLRKYKPLHVTPPPTPTPPTIVTPTHDSLECLECTIPPTGVKTPPFVGDDDLNIPFNGFPVTASNVSAASAASDEIVDQTKPDRPKTLIHWNVKGIERNKKTRWS